MHRYCQWILVLGFLAVTPEFATAGEFSLFKTQPKKPAAETPSKPQPPPVVAKSQNQQTAERIAAALREAKLSGYNIQIEYKNGVATLTGVVSDRKQQAKATKVVGRVPGVKKVENSLKLVPKKTPSDVAAKPQKADSAPKQPRLSLFKKPSVQTAAYQADGETSPGGILPVGGVQPEPSRLPMPINPQPATDATVILNNQKIAEQIAAALKSARLSGRNIEIRYQHGVALLNGTMDGAQQIARATQVVRQVPGVRAVDNRLMTPEQVAGLAARQPMPAQYASGPASGAPQPIPVAVGWPASNAAMGYQPPPGQPVPVAPNGAAPPQATPGPAMSGIPAPPSYGHPGQGASHTVYDMPHLPNHAWPSYAHYPNSAQVSYPQQYSASAWPYIGPFYPYPQIPLGWRKVQLEWDDGYWNLNFNPRTDKWFWFMNPKYW